MSLNELRRDRFPWNKQQAEEALSAELSKAMECKSEPPETPAQPRPLASHELDKYDPSNPLSVVAVQRFLSKLNAEHDNEYINHAIELLNRSPERWNAASIKFDKDLFERRLNHSPDSLTRSLQNLSFEQLSHLHKLVPEVLNKKEAEARVAKAQEIDKFVQSKRKEFESMGLDTQTVDTLTLEIRNAMVEKLLGVPKENDKKRTEKPREVRNWDVPKTKVKQTLNGPRRYVRKSKRFGVNYLTEDPVPGYQRVTYLMEYMGKPIAWGGKGGKMPLGFQLEVKKGNPLALFEVKERLYYDAKRQANFLNRNGTFELITEELNGLSK